MPMTKQSKPITLLGGLTSFGGAGNNYSMHVNVPAALLEFSDYMQALIEMVRELRKGKVRNGLVLANGGMVTYQYVVCLSNQPRNSPYPYINPLPNVLDDQRVPTVDEKAEREAVIEVSFLICVEGRADSVDVYC
jgi:hypothetical protein